METLQKALLLVLKTASKFSFINFCLFCCHMYDISVVFGRWHAIIVYSAVEVEGLCVTVASIYSSTMCTAVTRVIVIHFQRVYTALLQNVYCQYNKCVLTNSTLSIAQF